MRSLCNEGFSFKMFSQLKAKISYSKILIILHELYCVDLVFCDTIRLMSENNASKNMLTDLLTIIFLNNKQIHTFSPSKYISMAIQIIFCSEFSEVIFFCLGFHQFLVNMFIIFFFVSCIPLQSKLWLCS